MAGEPASLRTGHARRSKDGGDSWNMEAEGRFPAPRRRTVLMHRPPALPYRNITARRGGGPERCRAGLPTSPEGNDRPSPERDCRAERSTVWSETKRSLQRGAGTTKARVSSDRKRSGEGSGVPRAGRANTAALEKQTTKKGSDKG